MRILTVSKSWGDQVKTNDKSFNSAYKGIIYQIAKVVVSLKGKVSLDLENRLKVNNISDKKS